MDLLYIQFAHVYREMPYITFHHVLIVYNVDNQFHNSLYRTNKN